MLLASVKSHRQLYCKSTILPEISGGPNHWETVNRAFGSELDDL